MNKRKAGAIDAVCAIAMLLIAGSSTADAGQPETVAKSRAISTVSSTIPGNGDINPYGVFRVPRTVGRLNRGSILVSNFNNSANLQGTGTTVVQIAPDGAFSLFAQIDPNNLPGPCPGGVGLTTALVVLRSGWVIVGSLPTIDGTAATAQAGCLLVLDRNGNVTETITDPQINGPWDMTVFDESGDEGNHSSDATLFVTNVLNGTVVGSGQVVNQGTVLRIALAVPPASAPTVESMTVVGSGFPQRTDPAALVIGPTGLALSKNNKTLYVADSLNNRIAAIENPVNRNSSAGIGSTISSGGSLNDPLGMTLSVNGTILTVNGNDGFLVETNSKGVQIFTTLLDNTGNPPGAGALFGLTDVPGQGLYFVDDASNTLNLFH